MEQIFVDTWDDFETRLAELESDHQKRKNESPFLVSELLFRGQGNADWGLLTTMERFFAREVSLRYYYRLALVAKPRIESFTNANWDTPIYKDYEEWLEKQDDIFLANFPGYEYLAYLRHHGFPSPLLDWTASSYIATFFAFNRPPADATHVAIFAYCERPGGGKIASGGQATIHSRGPYIQTHQRHFLQQSQYTICTVRRNNELYYAPHESVIERNDETQDLLWKFYVPVAERRNVLRKLSRMNINAFSLFGSEDSLLETIATTDIMLKDRDL